MTRIPRSSAAVPPHGRTLYATDAGKIVVIPIGN